MDKVTLPSAFSQISAPWQPHVAGELNGQLIKLVKFQGEFVWHHHDNEDEMFLVVKGQFRMDFLGEASGPKGQDSSERDSARLEAVPFQNRQLTPAGKSARATQDKNNAGKSIRATQPADTRSVTIREGEFIIVPRGVEHKPVADEECWVMLFEPASTLNTGNVVNERTVRDLKRV